MHKITFTLLCYFTSLVISQAQTVRTHTISTNVYNPSSVYATDMDGDGDMDALSASEYDDKIAWYENDGAQKFTSHTISTNADGAWSVYAADMDGDGDMDVLSASWYDNKIAWYENDGAQKFTPHTISTAAHAATSVYAADIDGDGDMDVISASMADDKIAWYENNGAQKFTAHTISSVADGTIYVYAADMDGDGDMDVLSASWYDDKTAWYENDGAQKFTVHTIPSVANSRHTVYAADMDGDGDVDILSDYFADDKIAWYEFLNLPTLNTSSIVSITSITAVSGGNVSDDGDAPVTARGVCWSTSPNPSTADNTSSNGTGTGVFTSALSGLSPNTTYYVRAYATSSVGTAYGNEISFTTNIVTGILSGNAFSGSIYPNPTSGKLTLDLDASYNEVELEIVNSSGMLVQKSLLKNTAALNFEIQGAPGLYFITIRNGGIEKTLKIVKR